MVAVTLEVLRVLSTSKTLLHCTQGLLVRGGNKMFISKPVGVDNLHKPTFYRHMRTLSLHVPFREITFS